MGKTGKWLKHFFTGKKDSKKKDKMDDRTPGNDADDSSTAPENYPTTPMSIPHSTTNPKEKGRWSFRRSSATAPRESNSNDGIANGKETIMSVVDTEDQQKKHAMAVAAATAAAADAAVVAAQAAAAVIRLTAGTATATPSFVEEAAAIKIQSVYRSYLARKALRALKGLVKLQALARGHLVRKQAKATLQCMQTLVMLQAKVLAQRRIPEDTKPMIPVPPTTRSPTPNARYQLHHGSDNRFSDENIKIVEMDVGELRGTRKSTNNRNMDPFALARALASDRDDVQSLIAPSALSDFSPRTFSGHLDDPNYTAKAALISHSNPQVFPGSVPQYAESSFSYDYPLYPNYMANTESSRAKARSQSAPKQRPPDTPHFERQPSNRRRPSVEGRNGIALPRAVRMQRSSSNLSSTAQNFHYPWSLKLDRSAMSVRDSESESICTYLTNTEYCRSLIGFEVADPRKSGTIGATY